MDDSASSPQALRKCLSNTQPHIELLLTPPSQRVLETSREPIAILRSLTVGQAPHVEIFPEIRDVTFGRQPDQSSTRHLWVTVNDKRVSSVHCRLRRVDQAHLGAAAVPQFFVQDTSSNGTYLNGKRLEKGVEHPLKSGDELSLVVNSQRKHLGTRSRLFCAFILRVLGVERSSVLEDAGNMVEQKYNVLSKVLGSGAFSQVLLCTSKRTGKQVAVKVVDKKKFMQFRIVRHTELTVESEKEVMETIDHPNVVRLYETFDTSRYCYLVMEYMPGGDLLQRILDHGIYQPVTTRRLFQDVLNGIQCLHDNGIAHRDIKPENILLTRADEEAVAKLADMGLAKHVEEYASAQAQRATVCGTPHYYAPEMVLLAKRGESAASCGRAVDMWAAGVVLYIMLVGFPPFDEEGLYDQIASGCYNFDAEQWRGVSSLAQDLVQKLMRVDAGQRITVLDACEHPWMEAELPPKRRRSAQGMDPPYAEDVHCNPTRVGQRRVATPQISLG